MKPFAIIIVWIGFMSGVAYGQPANNLKSNEQSNVKLKTMDTSTDPQIRGMTIRWAWMDGFNTSNDASVGYTHEHTFHKDGTVTWKALSGPQKGHSGTEEEYASIKVADEVYAVSYLAASGHTLTVVLNFKEMQMTGVASGKEVWHTGSGPFEVIE